jgi:hypothetical protein
MREVQDPLRTNGKARLEPASLESRLSEVSQRLLRRLDNLHRLQLWTIWVMVLGWAIGMLLILIMW